MPSSFRLLLFGLQTLCSKTYRTESPKRRSRPSHWPSQHSSGNFLLPLLGINPIQIIGGTNNLKPPNDILFFFQKLIFFESNPDPAHSYLINGSGFGSYFIGQEAIPPLPCILPGFRQFPPSICLAKFQTIAYICRESPYDPVVQGIE